MSKKKNQPCSQCGLLMWPDSRRNGLPVCRECWCATLGVPTCGTPKGHRRHRTLGEPPCDPCRDAWNVKCRESRKLAVGRGWVQSGREPPKFRRTPGRCSKCGKGILATLPDPLCALCRGNRPGYNVRISRSGRLAVYERDRWTCSICCEPVDPVAPVNSTWDATLDHIVPRSLGGTDDPSNLRIAHRWCNSVRGDLRFHADEDLQIA